MRVIMAARISGTRDGVEWPAPGEAIDLPDAEAASLLAGGLAKTDDVTDEPVTEPDVETATAPKCGVRTATRKG